MHLQRALREAGYQDDVVTFRDLVIELFQTHYPPWTDETLLHNPIEAHRYCDRVRHRAKAPLPDELILRCLTNVRKRACA
jgi:hypothetical protein